MRERKSGCIITIASRAATVDTMLGLGYNDAKAGVTRATHCLQLELDMDGLGEQVHTYALHPGGKKNASRKRTGALIARVIGVLPAILDIPLHWKLTLVQE
jgi:NAD(P)-dependent dehydrogenase (short-subunit alcohol dehydrogenase family)